MDGARHQLLPGTGFAQHQHRGIGGRDDFHLPHDALERRAGADNFLEFMRSAGFVRNLLGALALREILHEGNPSKRRRLQDSARDQNRAPAFHPCECTPFQRACRRHGASLLRGRVHAEARYSGATISAHCSPLAINSSRLYPTMFEKRVVGVDECGRTRPKRCRRWSIQREAAGGPLACAARFVDPVTRAKVAHHPGKALQLHAFVSESRCQDVRPKPRPILFLMPSLISEMTLGSRPFQFFLQIDAKSSSSE